MYQSNYSYNGKVLHLYSSEKGITKLTFGDKELEDANENNHIKELKKELKSYFSGNLKKFKVSTDPKGTEFQKSVWKSLKNIPYGETCTYKDIALKVGGANYSRAVGMANNKNPLPILVPCHRVVGASGDLVGYAFGLDVKKNLLELEANE